MLEFGMELNWTGRKQVPVPAIPTLDASFVLTSQLVLDFLC